MENQENLITEEQAKTEVAAWLDYKHISAEERALPANEAAIKVLISAVKNGSVSIADEAYMLASGSEKLTGPVITQTLIFPVGSMTELKYKPRATTGALLSGTKNLNGIGMAVYRAYATELTGKLDAQLVNLDSQDSKIMQAITTFFL